MAPSPHPLPRTILRDFLGFLKAPAVLRPSGVWSVKSLASWGVMTLFHIGVLLLVILPLVTLWQQAFDLPPPDAFDKFPKELLLPIVVIVAPILEEIAFRGWQTGRPRVLPGVISALLLLLLAVAGPTLGLVTVPVGVRIAIVVAIVLLGPVGWFVLRRRGTPRWYLRAYPLVFYGVALVFAGVHLLNYAQFSLLAIPLVLPQLWAGLTLAFVRMRLGLVASIAVHMASNGAALALASLAG
jgi:membrane protease YdiL (CAAX protease family)